MKKHTVPGLYTAKEGLGPTSTEVSPPGKERKTRTRRKESKFAPGIKSSAPNEAIGTVSTDQAETRLTEIDVDDRGEGSSRGARAARGSANQHSLLKTSSQSLHETLHSRIPAESTSKLKEIFSSSTASEPSPDDGSSNGVSSSKTDAEWQFIPTRTRTTQSGGPSPSSSSGKHRKPPRSGVIPYLSATRFGSDGKDVASSLARLKKVLEGRRKTLFEVKGLLEAWTGEIRAVYELLTSRQVNSSAQVFSSKTDSVAQLRAPNSIASLESSIAGLEIESCPGVASDGSMIATRSKGAEGIARRQCTIHILCLGLGKPSESREAQFQFILLELMADLMHVERSDVSVYDPMFTNVDVALMRSRGFQVIDKNECGTNQLESSDHVRHLAFLPHCPAALYNAFISANWRSGVLGVDASYSSPKTIMLANDFQEYADHIPTKTFQNSHPAMTEILPALAKSEFTQPPHHHVASNAFSSLVFQYLDENLDWEREVPHPSQVGTELITSELETDMHASS